MNKEDLIALGIDEEVAKQVMVLHGKTVTQLNTKVATAEGERDSAQEQLAANQKEFDALKKSAEGNSKLTQQLADLQTKFDDSETKAKEALAAKEKDFAIQLALKDANPLDESIVFGLLDKETIKVTDDGLQGFKEQLDSLKENKSFLFQATEQQQTDPPAKRVVQNENPSSSGKDLPDLAKLGYSGALKLKQENPDLYQKAVDAANANQ